MIHKNFETISKNDIDSLVSNEVKEGRTIEYKEELPGGKDSDKKEFLADVASFANAAGGDLLYGVVEKRDGQGKATGVPERVPGLAKINVNSETCRLDSMIQSGIGPRIAGLRIGPIAGFADGPVILVRIPKSYSAPHMVTFQEWSRFYSRNSGGKYLLDVGELRSAFALSESLPERVRRFRDERLGRIVAGETPFRMPNPSKLVLHILPVMSLSPGTTIDLFRLKDQFYGLPLPCFQYPNKLCRFNFDGLLTHDTQAEKDSCVAYAQCYRNGAIEFVDAWTLKSCSAEQAFFATWVEQVLVASLKEYVSILTALDVMPPVVVMPSVLGVRRCFIKSGRFGDVNNPIDRDDLFLPDVLVEDFNEDAAKILRPAFDALWQAGGWRRSLNYKDDGT
jgi:hypothetical protein